MLFYRSAPENILKFSLSSQLKILSLLWASNVEISQDLYCFFYNQVIIWRALLLLQLKFANLNLYSHRQAHLFCNCESRISLCKAGFFILNFYLFLRKAASSRISAPKIAAHAAGSGTAATLTHRPSS